MFKMIQPMLDVKFNEVKSNFNEVKSRFDVNDTKFDEVKSNINELSSDNVKFEKNMNKQLNEIDERFHTIKEQVIELVNCLLYTSRCV